MPAELDEISADLTHQKDLTNALRAVMEFVDSPDTSQRRRYINSTFAILNDLERAADRVEFLSLKLFK